MATLTIPAARVKQGDLVLYATSIKVKDLTSHNFYSVETLDPDNTNDTGFQRLLNTARAKKLADYILKGQDRQDAFLPTSILLATVWVRRARAHGAQAGTASTLEARSPSGLSAGIDRGDAGLDDQRTPGAAACRARREGQSRDIVDVCER